MPAPTVLYTTKTPQNRYFISPIETLGVQSSPPWCTKHVLADELDLIPYTVPDVNGGYYSGNMKGVMLQPVLRSMVANMSIGDWTLTPSTNWSTQDVGYTTTAGYNPRGPWTSGSSYAVNDSVTYIGNTYVCILAITNSTTAPTSNTTNFSLDASGTAYQYTHLVAMSANPNLLSGASLNGNFVANPTIVLSLQRTELQQNYANTLYSFTFGGGTFGVSWNGKSRYVTLNYPAVIRDPVTGNITGQQILAIQHRVKESDSKAFYFDTNMVWQIQAFGSSPQSNVIPGQTASTIGAGQLWITCSAFGNDPWIINDVVSIDQVVIPQGNFTIEGQGSRWWFNVNQLQYDTTGSFSTTPLLMQPTTTMSQAVTPSTLAGRIMQWAIWGTGGYAQNSATIAWDGVTESVGNLPLWYPNCAAYISCDDPAGGVFTVHMSGDGFHTPVIQRWQAWYDPIYTTPTTPLYIDITEFVQTGTPEEHLTASNEPNTFTMVVDNHKRQYENCVNSNTPIGQMKNGASTMLRGEVIISIQTGYLATEFMSDGTTQTYTIENPRNVFICQQPDSDDPVNRQWTRTFNCADLMSRLSGTKLTTAPCYLGASYDYALRSILAWGGINPIWFQPNSDFNTSIVTGQIASFAVDDPLRDYSSAPFDPEFGVNALDFYRQLCEQGVRSDFIAQFVSDMATVPTGWSSVEAPVPYIIFRWDIDAQINLTPIYGFYGGEQTTALGQYDIAMADSKASMSIAGKPNLICVVGRDIDGNQIIATAPQAAVDVDLTWLHSAAVHMNVLHKPDLLTYAACQRCASWYWFTLLRPRLTATFHTVDATMCSAYYRNVVNINFPLGAYSDYEPAVYFSSSNTLYKIDSLTIKHLAETYDCQVTAVDLFIIDPSTQS